jgi:hypothetical protein
MLRLSVWVIHIARRKMRFIGFWPFTEHGSFRALSSRNVSARSAHFEGWAIWLLYYTELMSGACYSFSLLLLRPTLDPNLSQSIEFVTYRLPVFRDCSS